MTARQPIRSVRASWTAPDQQPDPLEVAHAEVREARLGVEAARRAVSARTAGASSLAVAEFRLSRALDRLAELGGTPSPSYPSPAGGGPEAA